MLEVSEVTLENIVNECRELDVKCDKSMDQDKSSEHNHVNRFSNDTLFQNVFSLRKLLTECWL